MGGLGSGRPPVPTAILEARGSRRAQGRRAEPRPQVEAPACPAWLSKEAKAEWRRQVKALVAMGVVAKCDRALLAVYCEAWGEFVQAAEAIGKSGLLIKDPDGDKLRRNPLLTVRDHAAERLLKLAAQFGFSPAARTRVQAVAGGRKPDAFERYLHDAQSPAEKYFAGLPGD
jgi:P27 family predicted phage terminase small subunit